MQCFGGDCYALAFGVPAALMVVALGESSSNVNIQADVVDIEANVRTVTDFIALYLLS